MVTKSLWSTTPPRSRGGEPPMDVQEIEVELASPSKSMLLKSNSSGNSITSGDMRTSSRISNGTSLDRDYNNTNSTSPFPSPSQNKILTSSTPRTKHRASAVARQSPPAADPIAPTTVANGGSDSKEQAKSRSKELIKPSVVALESRSSPDVTAKPQKVVNQPAKRSVSNNSSSQKAALPFTMPSLQTTAASMTTASSHTPPPCADIGRRMESPSNTSKTANPQTTTSTASSQALPPRAHTGRCMGSPSKTSTTPKLQTIASTITTASSQTPPPSADTVWRMGSPSNTSKAPTTGDAKLTVAAAATATTTTSPSGSPTTGGTKVIVVAAAAATRAPTPRRSNSPAVTTPTAQDAKPSVAASSATLIKLTSTRRIGTAQTAGDVKPTIAAAAAASRAATPCKSKPQAVTTPTAPDAKSTVAAAVANSKVTPIRQAPALSPTGDGKLANKATAAASTTTPTRRPVSSAITPRPTKASTPVPTGGQAPLRTEKGLAARTAKHYTAQPTGLLTPKVLTSLARVGRRNSKRDMVVRDGKLCHVRLTFAFLTGVTTEHINDQPSHLQYKGNKTSAPSPKIANTTSTDEILPSGYVMLGRGDATMAISHPMKAVELPPVDTADPPRQTLVWTDHADTFSSSSAAEPLPGRHDASDDDDDASTQNDDDECHDERSQLTLGANQRRLYFQVEMLREVVPTFDETQPASADNATDKEILKEVAANYSPELIPLLIGLKKGDEMLPLGIATLVVSGREVSGQYVDLPVRILTEAEGEIYNVTSTAIKQKRKKGPAFRFFGKKENTGPIPPLAFAKDAHSYNLAPNATLRARLDVRSGIYNEHGPAMWGDVMPIQRLDDNTSHTTVTVYDMSTQGDREVVQRSHHLPLDERHEYVEVLPNPNGTTIISSPGGPPASAATSGSSSRQHSRSLQGRDDESHQTRFEVTSIFAGSTDLRSSDSNSESMSLLERLENTGLCGGLEKLDDQALSTENSFESSLPDPEPLEMNPIHGGGVSEDAPSNSAIKLLPQVASSYTGASARGEMNQTFSASSSGGGLNSNSPSQRVSNAEDEEDDDDDDDADYGACASKSSGADSSTDVGTKTTATTGSVGSATYEQAMRAKRTLLRYASRVGVEMEDLLEDELASTATSEFRRNDDCSYSVASSSK